MQYFILSANSAHLLVMEVNEFRKDKTIDLIGGPYSDGTYHYQALWFTNQTQLND